MVFADWVSPLPRGGTSVPFEKPRPLPRGGTSVPFEKPRSS